MEISTNNRLILSGIGLVLYFLSFFFDGVVKFILLSVPMVLLAVTLGFSLRRETYRSNMSVWYAALFCMVLSSLLANLGSSLFAGLLGVLAFALFSLLLFRAMYFLQAYCRRDCEDELDKEDELEHKD